MKLPNLNLHVSLLFLLRSIFPWRNTLWIFWRTARFPLRAWRMERSDKKRERKQRSSELEWTPGNVIITSLPELNSLWVIRRRKADVICIQAVYKLTLMSLIYDHFLWLGSKAPNWFVGVQLSPAKSFSPNCCHGIAKFEVSLAVQHACWSMWEACIFFFFWGIDVFSKWHGGKKSIVINK